MRSSPQDRGDRGPGGLSLRDPFSTILPTPLLPPRCEGEAYLLPVLQGVEVDQGLAGAGAPHQGAVEKKAAVSDA